ncbi:hypothetical protein [Arthrobacter zhaoguopingii]|uniref:hypothetical protein n=1 Tax=Arthrobacter zhaoguopingii TaxID=2681491 RepID=UPI00135C8B46|nr:hypothetical protein [Arthrobacter zhaoguopingii]
MGIFDGVERAFGGLRPLSDEELEDEREALRLRYVSHKDLDNELQRLDNELRRFDAEMVRRENEAYAREPPEPREPRRREHGWYLPKDD